MDLLLPILEILKKQPQDRLKLIEESLRPSSQMYKLYLAIKKGLVKNDKEARYHLYGSHAVTSKYYEVKRRLRSRLVECLFIFNNPDNANANSQDAYYSCLRNWIASRILVKEQAQHAAHKLLQTVISVSQKFEFTDLTILTAQQLIGYYAIHNPNPTKYAYYSNLIELNHKILRAETSAEIAYLDIIILFAGSQRSVSEKYIQQISDKHDNKLYKFKDINSRRFLRMSHLYQIACAEITGQNELAYDICTRASQLIRKKPYQSPGVLLSLDVRSLANLIKLGRYHEAKSIALKQMFEWKSHRSNWHVLSFYYFVLNCHERDYKTAYETVHIAIKHKSFKGLHGKIKQLWYINHAFAHFFLQCGKVQLTDEERTRLKKFRIYKFINEVPIYSKDKRGMNISILIIQILFFVWEKKYKKVQLSINSLNRYCKKYLTDDDTYRSHCFIKMLVNLAKADFHPIRGQRYARNFNDKLLSRPLATSRQAIEIEIVPYEHLWEMILEMCGRNGNGANSTFPSVK